MKRMLFILRSTPYGNSKAQEGIDAILAASVFNQEISVLFMDEGIWQMHNHQQSLGIKMESIQEKVDRRNIAAQLESFHLYDIKNVFVDKKALAKFIISKKDLILRPKSIGDKDIRALIASHDLVLTY